MDLSELKELSSKVKIFENARVMTCLDNCLAEGYVPLNAPMITDLKRYSLLCGRELFNTRTVRFNGICRDAELFELANIRLFYDYGGRIISLRGKMNHIDIVNSEDLYSLGRFAAVPVEGNVKDLLLAAAVEGLKQYIPKNLWGKYEKDKVLRERIHRYFI